MINWQMLGFSLVSAGILILNSSTGYAAAPYLSLQDSINMALTSSPSIKMAAADNEKAGWGIQESKSALFPSVALNSSNTQSSGLAGSSFNNSLRLNWQLYSGGRTESLIDQAKLNVENSNLGVIKAKQQTVLDATNAYYAVLQARNIKKVNQETVDSLTIHLNNAQAQYSAGVVAKSDVLRSEVELANAKQNFTKAQNAYDVAVAVLNNMIGQPLDTENEYSDTLSFVQYDVSLEDSVKLALTKRPEIAQAENAVDIAEAGQRTARSASLPTVNVSGTTGLTGNSFPGNNDNWSIGFSASWNVFDSGLTKAKVKEAEAGSDKAMAAKKQIRDSIELEVRQAYLSMIEAQQRIETAEVAQGKAGEDLAIAETKYQSGMGTNLDVLDAQLSYTQAKTNTIGALYDYNVSKAKLEKAIGTDVTG